MQQIDNFCRKLHTPTKKKVYRKRKHGGSTLNESQVNERNCCKSESYYTLHTNKGFHFLYSALRLYELILKFGSLNWQMIGKNDLKKEIKSIQKNKN